MVLTFRQNDKKQSTGLARPVDTCHTALVEFVSPLFGELKMDEMEYTVTVNSTGKEITVVGYDRAIDEAYMQCLNSECPYEEIKIIDTVDGSIVDRYNKDGFEITQA
jgi:hypothetical protein